jgi:hypothetical protein
MVWRVWAAGHGVGFKQGAIQTHQCGLLILHVTARAFRIKPKVILTALCRRSLLRFPFDDAHHPHLPIRILQAITPYVTPEEGQRPARPRPVVRPNSVWPYV